MFVRIGFAPKLVDNYLIFLAPTYFYFFPRLLFRIFGTKIAIRPDLRGCVVEWLHNNLNPKLVSLII